MSPPYTRCQRCSLNWARLSRDSVSSSHGEKTRQETKHASVRCFQQPSLLPGQPGGQLAVLMSPSAACPPAGDQGWMEGCGPHTPVCGLQVDGGWRPPTLV